jgi:hypothetical protein
MSNPDSTGDAKKMTENIREDDSQSMTESNATPTKSPNECAIDEDSSEVDENFVLVRRAEKIMAEQRRRHANAGVLPVQQVVPFHFSPMFLPLTLSNFESCVALENAAFTNPSYRCSPEKASSKTLPLLSSKSNPASLLRPCLLRAHREDVNSG